MAGGWNVIRGVNRLFVVFSVLWYAGAGVILWPQWRGALDAERGVDSLEQRLNRRAKQLEAVGWSFVAGEPAEPPQGDALDRYFAAAKKNDPPHQTEAKQSPTASPTPGATQETALDRDAFLARQRALEEARSRRPVSATVCVAVAPVLTYLLAAAFTWAIRGFRQTN